MGAETQVHADAAGARSRTMTPLAAAGSLSAAFVVLVGSRIIGLFREVLITLTFGFSKLTDLFFQATFVPTNLMNLLNGPFTTAFLASFNAAGPAERSAWLHLYRRRALELGLAIAPLFAAGGAVAALLVPAADRGNVLVTCVLLAPACTAVVVVGYAAAAANACGTVARANGLIALMNLAFVAGVLALWVWGPEGRSWMLPTAFTLASSVGAILGWRWLNGLIAEQEAAWGPQAPAPARRLPGLSRSFVLALAEFAGSLATQLVVLALATHAGVGWASAAALAQRICLSAIGFVVFPTATLAAVQIIHAPARAARLFALTMLTMTGGAAVIALALIWLKAPLQTLLTATSRLDAASARLLVELIAPFSLWLVATAAYTPANKVLFAIGRGRLCVAASLTAYGLANIARLAAGLQGRFGLAIALGAAIELILALGLAAVAWTLLRRRAAGV